MKRTWIAVAVVALLGVAGRAQESTPTALESVPVDVFVEVASILNFTPSVRGGITAGIGARFWF